MQYTEEQIARANQTDLASFLNDPKNSLTASGHTDPKPEAPEKEDTAHEEN